MNDAQQKRNDEWKDAVAEEPALRVRRTSICDALDNVPEMVRRLEAERDEIDAKLQHIANVKPRIVSKELAALKAGIEAGSKAKE